MTQRSEPEKKPVPLTQEQAVKFVTHVVTALTGSPPGVIDAMKLQALIKAAYEKEGATIVLWR